MQNLEKCVLIFKALGDSTRLKIIECIVSGSKSVSEIAAELNMMQSAISHQLAFLKLNGIVAKEKKGKEVFYRLDDDHVKFIIETVDKHASHKNDE